jgi:hypothetical protein
MQRKHQKYLTISKSNDVCNNKITVLTCIPMYFNYSILGCDITWFGKQAHFLDELDASIFKPNKGRSSIIQTLVFTATGISIFNITLFIWHGVF